MLIIQSIVRQDPLGGACGSTLQIFCFTTSLDSHCWIRLRTPARATAAAQRPQGPAGIQYLDPFPSESPVVALGPWSRPRSAMFFCTFTEVRPARTGSHHLPLGLPHTMEDSRCQFRLIFFLRCTCSASVPPFLSSLSLLPSGGGGCSDMRDRCLKHRWNPKKKTERERGRATCSTGADSWMFSRFHNESSGFCSF